MNRSTESDHHQRSIPLQKRYGQHHLVRGSICDPLVDFLAPTGELVVEIDIAWAATLSRRSSSGALRLLIMDAATIDWRQLPVGTLVTGNLPFNVSTVLIEQILPRWQQIPRAAFLVQREVGDRLLAAPGDGAYGALSVLTAARARVSKLGRVSRGSFRPPPKVDGVFIGLELVAPILEESQMRGFTATVRQAFAQRRKQLRNALASGWGREVAAAVLAAAGIDPRVRAEELSLEEFLEMHEAYRQVVSG